MNLLPFVIVAILIGFFLSYIWSSSGFVNALCKMLFSAFTVWGVLVLISLVFPGITHAVTASGMHLM